MRHRHAALAVAAISLLGVAACGDDAPTAAPATAATPVASAPVGTPETSPATSPAAPRAQKGQMDVGKGTAPNELLSAAGLGPYLIGVAQKDLSSAQLVGGVAKKDACTTANGLGRYHAPALGFGDGRLQRVTVTSADVSTTAGARVGSSFAEIKSSYPKGQALDNWVGATAWYSVDGGNALLFAIKDDKVASIDAGDQQSVRFRYTDNQGC